MIRTLAVPLILIAAPAAAHEASVVAHLHPHGGEIVVVGLALATAIAAWRLTRR